MKIKTKSPKISVHIPLYLEQRKKKQFINFKKVCKSFLQLSNNTKLFIHSNKKFTNTKKIKFFYYDFKKLNQHPYKLTWFSRELMERQQNTFDIFIYCEDDILFTKKNFNYWLKYKDLFIKNNFNVGFTRYEIKNKTLYSADQIKKSKYYVNLLNKKYIVPNNPYCGFWIYDKKEFKKFIKTKYWKFKWKWLTISGILLIREMATIGWHGVNINGKDMNKYIATIIPLKNKKIDNASFVRHLSNNFSINPAGLFGTVKINDIPDKNLKEFRPSTKVERFFKRVSYIIYSFSRINLKKYFKNK